MVSHYRFHVKDFVNHSLQFFLLSSSYTIQCDRKSLIFHLSRVENNLLIIKFENWLFPNYRKKGGIWNVNIFPSCENKIHFFEGQEVNRYDRVFRWNICIIAKIKRYVRKFWINGREYDLIDRESSIKLITLSWRNWGTLFILRTDQKKTPRQRESYHQRFKWTNDLLLAIHKMSRHVTISSLHN